MPMTTVVETPEFLRRAEATGITEAERTTIVQPAATDPEVGVSLGGRLRKFRVARSGGGKSGGYRVLHFYRSAAMPVFLLSVFAKNERDNINAKERAELIELCDLIAQTYGARR
jgi:hypothetical protein